MPPKRKNLSAVHSPDTQSNKRMSESPLASSGKRRKQVDERSLNKEVRKDTYCWMCHQLEIDLVCAKCQRVYHTACLKKKDLKFREDVCPECQLQSHESQNRCKYLTLDKLRELLDVAAKEFRKKFKSPDKMMFFQWPNIEDNKLVQKFDFEILEDNIRDERNPYRSLAEVTSDIKWIHHNFCILDGVGSQTAKEAEGFVKKFLMEISDIEDCPKCYYYMFVADRRDDFFVKICDPPHDIVWARLRGSSPWPAKCLRVENGKAHVRFFGTHDKANISIGNKTCLWISEKNPNPKASKLTDENLIPKNISYREAVKELLLYVNRYERKFGKKFKFYDTETPYKGEAPKSIRRKNNQDHLNVSHASYSEEIVYSPLPSYSGHVFSASEDNSRSSTPHAQGVNHVVNRTDQDVSAVNKIVEILKSCVPGVGSAASNEGEQVLNSLGNDDTADTTQISNILQPSTSPVLSADMIIEVASCDDVQTTYNHPLSSQKGFHRRNLLADRDIPGSNFRPFTTCTSTPVVTTAASLSNFNHHQLNTMSFSRPHNMLPDNANASFQEEVETMYSESQHIDLNPEVLSEEADDPLILGSSSASGSVADDDEVIFLSSSRRPRNSNFNPSVVLPYIFSGNPDLQSLFKDGRYILDTLFIRSWAFANRCPQAPELITNLVAEIRKLYSERNKLQREKEILERSNTANDCSRYLEEMLRLQEENESLKSSLDEERKKVETLEDKHKLTVANSRSIVESLHKQYLKKIQIDNDEIAKEYEQKLQEKDDLIKERCESIEVLKAEINALRTKILEMGEAYSLKLEELLKLQKEKMSWETKQVVKGMIDKHLNELGLTEKQQGSSSAIESHGRHRSADSCGNTNFPVKKSSRSSSTKSQNPYLRRNSLELEAAANQHFSHQMINQQERIQTIARKTSVNIQLEQTSKTITTTRNDGNIFGFNRPDMLYGCPNNPISTANAPFDLTQHLPHRDRYHPPSGLLPTPSQVTSRHSSSRKRQSRFTQ